MKPIFFIHNQKCGGTSFIAALRSICPSVILTSSIDVDSENKEFCSTLQDKNIIIAGHPSHIKYKSSKKMYEYVTYLYSNCKIIFPTRDPLNIILSWIYYYNTRIQNYIKLSNRIDARKSNYLNFLKKDIKLLGMAEHLSYCLNSKEIDGNGFDIPAENIEEIIIEFLKFCAFKSRGTSSHSPALTLTRNLVAPVKSINTLIQDSMRINPTIINHLVKTLDIVIYDVERINESTLTNHPLYSILGSDFVRELHQTRLNKSNYGSTHPLIHKNQSVRQFYKSLYPTEFQIHEFSQ